MRFCSAFILVTAVLLITVGAQAKHRKTVPLDEQEQTSAADFDSDGVINQDDNCVNVPNPIQRDDDADGFGDVCDNCTLDANHGQEDANGDGFGNRCDGDLNDDGIVDLFDFGIFGQCLSEPGKGVGNSCKIADFDSNHKVNSIDFQILEGMFGLPPGPSALAP